LPVFDREVTLALSKLLTVCGISKNILQNTQKTESHKCFSHGLPE